MNESKKEDRSSIDIKASIRAFRQRITVTTNLVEKSCFVDLGKQQLDTHTLYPNCKKDIMKQIKFQTYFGSAAAEQTFGFGSDSNAA